MSFSSSFLILFLAFTAYARTITDDSCETHISKLDTCAAVISFSGNCDSMTVNLSRTEYADCTTNSFFWSYPLNNLTLIIETALTEKHQPYTISIDNGQFTGAISHIYRIINHKETEVTTHDKKLVQHSDANYEVILKFQGPTHMSRYGVNINYETV